MSRGREGEGQIVKYIRKGEYHSASIVAVLGKVGLTPVGAEFLRDRAESVDRGIVFNAKYSYADMCWPCVENKEHWVALFKFRHERKIKNKVALSFYRKDGLNMD